MSGLKRILNLTLWISFVFGGFLQSKAQQKITKWIEGSYLHHVEYKDDGTFKMRFLDKQNDTLNYPYTTVSIAFNSNEIDFITDGYNLLSSQGDTIVNGGRNICNECIYNAFNKWIPATQVSIVLPRGNRSYYVITTTQSDEKCIHYFNNQLTDTFDYDEMRYSIVDMNANEGKGEVVVKNELLLKVGSPYFNKLNLTATRHANGRDLWIVKSSARFREKKYVFLATPDSLYLHHVQDFPKEFPEWCLDNTGQSCFNLEGNLYAECNARSYHTIYNFDRCTGWLSSYRTINILPYMIEETVPGYRGICFSPNGRFLYASTPIRVYQIDLWQAVDSIAVRRTSDSAIFYPEATFGTLVLTPTDKIYIGNWGSVDSFVYSIMDPDKEGLACNFNPNYMKAITYVNEPPNLPNYELGALQGSPCDTIRPMPQNWLLYPNPAHNITKIKVPASIRGEAVQVLVLNILGQMVLKQKYTIDNDYEIQVPLSYLSSGVYFLEATYKQDVYSTKMVLK